MVRERRQEVLGLNWWGLVVGNANALNKARANH